MYNKISEEKEPEMNQYIAFKSADIIFVGRYLGEKKASPFSATASVEVPVFVIDEWIPIRLWG